MRAMIVDDDPFILKLLQRQLEKIGADEVICFERARLALDFLEADPQGVSLLLCDLQMPEMDGIEMVRHLTRIGYIGGLALISGEDERILQTAGLLAEAHRLNLLGVLHKPIASEHLQALLQRMPAAGAVGRPPPKPDRYVPTAEDLRRAIANGELVNHVQPKINVSSGRVVGVECLVRWQHPQHGMVFPDQFIPLAEAAGLIGELTRVVLANALRQARMWQDGGLSLDIAVNVSMDDLVSLDFPEMVADQLAITNIPPHRLMLEITETQLMRDRLVALDVLTRLRLRQIGLSIDDFGTGNSSFSQLRDLPFTELKIDRGFVHGAARDVSRRAIYEASQGVARELGLKTVAEGVENQEDWDFLRSTQCDLAQGYFVGRPMPGADLPEWIDGWAVRYRDMTAASALQG